MASAELPGQTGAREFLSLRRSPGGRRVILGRDPDVVIQFGKRAMGGLLVAIYLAYLIAVVRV